MTERSNGKGGIVERWGAELRAIEQVATGHRSPHDLEGVLDLVLRQTAEMLDVTWGAAWLYEEATDAWYVAVSVGFSSEGAKGVRFGAGTALPCLVGERGEPMVVDDLNEVEFHRFVEEHNQLRSAMYAPLWLGQRTVGVLSVYSDRLRAYTNDDLQLLTAIGEHLGVAVAFSVMDERARRIVVLEERDRQARDLHDGVSQVLCSLRAWVLEAEQALQAGDEERGRALLASIRSLIDEADEEVRVSIRDLRRAPVARDFNVELDRARHRLELAGIAAVVEVAPDQLPEPVSGALAWILREATHNVVKHSEATKVRISLDAEARELVLVVEDNGLGMAVNQRYDESGDCAHMGLSVMRERASEIGGILAVASVRGEGTSIECRLPTTSSASASS